MIATTRETRSRYDGPAGALLPLGSLLSLHQPLFGRLLHRGDFSVADSHTILDVGSGAGQILQHLVHMADRDCRIVGFDLSRGMLRRARSHIGHRPEYIAGDVCALPFENGSFDCVTCGWVLEHVPTPLVALQEIARVLSPRGRFLLLATEDTWAGRAVSRLWKCRTYTRGELDCLCEQAGFSIRKQLWLTPLHRLFGMGGILLSAEKCARRGREPLVQNR